MSCENGSCGDSKKKPVDYVASIFWGMILFTFFYIGLKVGASSVEKSKVVDPQVIEIKK
jgi:hypothetical protein